jgi:arabinose-5-phosphate isomerase
MHTGNHIPKTNHQALISDALVEMSEKGLGMTAICSDANDIVGIFTDGDLRRVLAQTIDVHTTAIADVMTTECKTGHPDMLAAEILELMQRHKINALLIVDDQKQLVGAINMHDLLRAGVV